MEEKTNFLIKYWKEIGDQIQLLIISGVAGAFFRALIAPEKEIKKRLVQGMAGALSAVFLGGFFAEVLKTFYDTGVYGYLASGFIMGSAGEVFVKTIQERFSRDINSK